MRLIARNASPPGIFEYKVHVLDAQVRRIGPAELEGTIQIDVPEVHYNGDQRYNLHFVAQFNRPFDRLVGPHAL